VHLQVAACHRHIAMVLRTGEVYVWGRSALSDSPSAPTPVPGLAGYTILQVAACQGATVALALGGSILTWGKNVFGCLGKTGVMSQHTPMVLRSFHCGSFVETEIPCSSIKSGPFHCAAITTRTHPSCGSACNFQITWLSCASRHGPLPFQVASQGYLSIGVVAAAAAAVMLCALPSSRRF
jgi:alpha-tubulin suppressor-like RCC1 family protein